MDRIRSGFRGFFDAIREINTKYEHPRITVTPMVSVALLILRIYLLGMLLLLAYKFVTIVAVK